MRRIFLALISVLVAAGLLPSPAAARDIGVVAAPLRLVPTGPALQVSGLRSYFGTIELNSASDGLVVINRLPLERYLLGLQEVPLRWPGEALKAQAVAARTYALRALERPRAGAAATYGFDICATVACQVFSGADVVRASGGDRWRAAVETTESEAILYQGDPILARYHSTSGGRTYRNSQIFTSEGDYPYLQGVESTTEQASPLYRWEVTFTRNQVQRMLRRTGWLGPNGRIRSVGSRPSGQGRHYPDLVFRKRKGRVVRTAEEFRVLVRTLAPEMFPGLHPAVWPTTSGRLPETLPSNRYHVETRGRRIQIAGRGWGHGVGMSQWGAYGMAENGGDYIEILNHYYTGVSVAPYPDPEAIAVGVDWGRSRVSVTGEFQLRDGRGRTLVGDGLGTWTFRPAGAGAVEVVPPEGFGLPLEVAFVDTPEEVEAGDTVSLDVAVSRPARVRLPGQSWEVIEGRDSVDWSAPDEAGIYEVEVRARSGGRRRTDTISISVIEPAAEATPGGDPTEAEEEADEAGGEGAGVNLVWPGIVLMAVIGALLFRTLAGRMRT